MPDSSDFATNLRRISNAAWAYAAVATALELGLLERLREPVVEAELASACGIDAGLCSDLVEALIALGAVRRNGGSLEPEPCFELLWGPSSARVLRGEIRGDHLQITALLDEAREGRGPAGWRHEDPVTLTAQGETGRLFGLMLEALLPGLEGLDSRLREPGCRLLDVGAGVGVVSTEVCTAWPEVSAVGLEPHRTARELARSRIAADGLAGRIELRDQRLEDLDEERAYDLAFLPQPFLEAPALVGGLPRLWRALRPGGWLILLTHSREDADPLGAAAQRFRARAWGGEAAASEELRSLLAGAGFEASRLDHPVGSFRTICARRPERRPPSPSPLAAPEAAGA